MQHSACRKLDFTNNAVTDKSLTPAASKIGSSTGALSLFSSCPVTPLKHMQIKANKFASSSPQNTLKAFDSKFSKICEMFLENETIDGVRSFVQQQERLDLVCQEQSQKMRQILHEKHEELEKIYRIGNYAENFGHVASVSSINGYSCVNGNVSLNPSISHEEMSFLKNLSVSEMRDAYESECYKKKHAEAKVILLQKQNFDLEQRLSVANSLNQRRLEVVDQLSSALDEFQRNLLSKDAERDAKCAEIMDENSKLIGLMREQGADVKDLVKNIEEMSSNLVETQSRLKDVEARYDCLKSDHNSAKKQLADCQEINGVLREERQKLEDELKCRKLSEEEAKAHLLSSEKLYTELSEDLKRLKSELISQNSAHSRQIEEVERSNKAVNLEIMQDYEKRLQKQKDDLEAKKVSEIRRLKTEFEASLSLYDEKFREILQERDLTTHKLKAYETSFEENLRIMYYTVQQKLASKYYELVSEFASPAGIGPGPSLQITNQNRPPSSQSSAHCNTANALLSHSEHQQRQKEHEISADEFLAKLQKSDPLSSFRNMFPTNETASTSQRIASGHKSSTNPGSTSKVTSNNSGFPTDPQNRN